MKKLTFTAAILAVAAAAGLVVAETSVAVFARPGLRTGLVVDVAKAAQVEIIGALPAENSTAIVSRVTGVTTTEVAQVALDAAGNGTATPSATVYLLRGDSLLWTVSTSGVARVILTD